MKEKIKYIIIGILVGFIVFPTVALGGTFVSSLIHGKGEKEAIKILSEQVDALAGRVTVVETKVTNVESKVSNVENTVSNVQNQLAKDELCQQAQKLYTLIPPMQKDPATGQYIGRQMASNIVDEYKATLDYYNTAVAQNNIQEYGDPAVLQIDLNLIKQYYDAYESAKAKCGE